MDFSDVAQIFSSSLYGCINLIDRDILLFHEMLALLSE